MTDEVKGTDTPGQRGVPDQPSDAELNAMSREELVDLGGRLDGVETVFKEARWPVADTKAEKRAERSVARWLLLGGGFGLALLLIFYFETPLKRDLDGGLKITQDALCEGPGINDNRIVTIHLVKYIDPLHPHLDVELEALDDWQFDEEYALLPKRF